VKLRITAGMLILLGLSACAATPESSPVAEPAPDAEVKQFRTVSEAEASAKEDDLICRRERTVGSRFETKTCATRADWERTRRTAQDDMMRSNRGGPQPRN